MAITGEALGGSMLVQGWTDQNLGVAVGALSPNVEQGFGANSSVFNMAQQWGYIGWSMITEDAIANPLHPVTNQTWVTRVFIPVTAVNSKVDVVFTTAGTQTHWFMGIYNAAGTLMATTVDSTASVALGLVTLNWVTPTILQGGTFYWVVSNFTFSAAPALAGCTGASAAALNANLTIAAPEAATNVTLANAALPSPLVFASNVLFTSEPFIGLK
jgi:hypothetical protein